MEQKRPNKQQKRILTPAGGSILLAGILWGTMGLFVRGLNADNLNAMKIVEIRVFFATLILGLFLLLYNKKLFVIRLKDIWCFIGTGICSLTFFNFCYFQTILNTSMSVAAILLYTAPVIVVVLSALLFHEKITGRKILAMFIAFAGCVFVTGVFSSGGMVLHPKGLLIGLGAGLGYALYSIFSRYALMRGYHTLTISLYTFVFALLSTMVLQPPGEIIRQILSGNTANDLLLAVGIAIVATVLPYMFYTWGLQGVENGKASIMASIEPVVATVLGIIVYGERLTWDGMIGVALVLVAIVLLNT